MNRVSVVASLLLVWTLCQFSVLPILGPAASPALAQTPPAIKKWFGAGSIAVGEKTSLTFQIVGSDELTGLGFSDLLPEGLAVAAPNGFSGFRPEGACAGGTLTAAPGSRSIRLSGAVLTDSSAAASCTFSVDVTGTSAGRQHGAVTVWSDQSPGNTSAASITVDKASIGRAPTTTALILSPEPASSDAAVALVASVTSSAGAPTGKVSFSSESTVLGTAQLSPDGRATLTLKLGPGRHSIRAAYAGGQDHLASTSPPAVLTVEPPVRTRNELQIAGAILLLVIVLMAIALLLRNIVRALVAPVFRFVYGRLYRPISRGMLRLLRFLRVVRRAPAQEKVVESFVGLSVGAIAHALTETDAAIGKALGDKTIPLNPTHRLFCSWIEPTVDPNALYDKDRATVDVGRAREFFNATIPIDSNHLNLYDDIVGAFTVDLFKHSDGELFYVLSAFRKAINANVVALSIVCSFVIALIVILNVVFSTAVDFYWLFNLIVSSYLPAGSEFLEAPAEMIEIVNKLAFGAISVFFVGYPAMGFYYYLIYDAFQRNNGKGMDLFLNQYLANINSHFKEVHRNATQAVVEERSDIHEVQSDVSLWITNLQWMAFRVFFIECFFRGLLFQMRRNASFALVLVPLAILLPGIGIVIVFDRVDIFRPLVFDVTRYTWFYLLVFALMSFRYLRYRTDALEAIAGSVTARWFKFRELNLEDAMSKIMESYINQLDQWRSRYRERGGPGM